MVSFHFLPCIYTKNIPCFKKVLPDIGDEEYLVSQGEMENSPSHTVLRLPNADYMDPPKTGMHLYVTFVFEVCFATKLGLWEKTEPKKRVLNGRDVSFLFAW